jgi:hypothetical protein
MICKSRISSTQTSQQKYTSIINFDEVFFNQMLDDNIYLHAKYVHYLANKHEAHYMKLKYWHQPFAFVFLIKVQDGFQLVLETLDTEEATYMWNLGSTENCLQNKIEEAFAVIDLIYKNGRKNYLQNCGDNFRRVLHDYEDMRRGFVEWVGAVEGSVPI